MNYKDLDITYEMRSGDVMRIWWCVCGNMLKEDNMSELALQYELERNA